MWKVFLVLVVLGSVWSRTLDDTVGDVSTRPKPHGREDSQSTEEIDLIKCTDCKENIQTNTKAQRAEKFVQHASQIRSHHKLENKTNKTRNGHRRRNPHTRKRDKTIYGKRKPYISIGGVKIRVNNEKPNRRKSKTNAKQYFNAQRSGKHVVKVLENKHNVKNNENHKPKAIGGIALVSLKDESIEENSENGTSDKNQKNENHIKSKLLPLDKFEVANQDLVITSKDKELNPKIVKVNHVKNGALKNDSIVENKTKHSSRQHNHESVDVNSSDKQITNTTGNILKTEKRKQNTEIRKLDVSERNTANEEKTNQQNEDKHLVENRKKIDITDGIKPSVQVESNYMIQNETKRKDEFQSDKTDEFNKREHNGNIPLGSDDKTKDTLNNDIIGSSNRITLRKNRKIKTRRKSRGKRKKKPTKKKDSATTLGVVHDDRWARPGLIQVPDVKRLERRLHPTVEAPVNDIITSFRKILHQMQHSIYLIDFDYKHTFNVTRWGIMTGVREELLNIAKENDNVYDAVMDASLHTKELYMRAHQRKRFGEIQALTMGPIRDRSGPRSIDLRSKYQYARDEMRSAQLLKRKIHDLQRQRSTLRYDYIELTRKISEKLPTRALYDLSRRVNQTIENLEYSRAMRDALDRGHLQRHSQKSSYRDMRIARDFIQDAHEIMEIVNQQYSENHLKAKEIKKSRVSTYRNTSADLDLLHMQWWASVDRAKINSNRLFDMAAMILMKFKPLFQQADVIILKLRNGTLETKFERDIRNIRQKIQHLNTTLFDIKADVCTERYIACIPKEKEELDTEEIDKVESSGMDTDDTEDGEDDLEKMDTGKETTTVTATKSYDEATKNINGTTDKDMSTEATDSTGKVVERTTPKPGSEDEIDIDIDTEDDSEEIYFSSGDELIDESSGEEPKISTDDTENVDVPKPMDKSAIEPTQKTTLTLPDTDDEDIYEEIKRTKKATQSTTTTMQTTTTTTPEKTPTPDEEEEEEEEDGGGAWWWLDDPFGLIQDQMFGGSNSRRKRDTSEVAEKLSNITLTELIQQHLKNRSGVNKDLLKKAKQRLQSLEGLQKTLTLVQSKLSLFENNTLKVRGFIHKWKAKSAEFKTVHERVVDISKDVKFKGEVFGEQIEKAVRKAESKLQRMKDVYERNKDRVTDTSGPDNAKEALELANKVKDNIAEIVNIKKLNPAPCKKLEMMDNSMRANISVLRQKIRQAKLITASLKVAVNLDGTSHLALPVSDRDQSKKSHLHVDMMVKSNTDNGAIAVVQTENTGAIAVSLEDYVPTVTVYDDGKYKIEEQQGESPLHNDTWYRIILNRFGTVYNLTVYNGSSLLQSFLTQVDSDDYPTVYNRPSSVFVGGAHDDYYLDNWNGCVGNIRVNGEFLNALQADSESIVPRSCTILSKTLVPENSLILDSNSQAFYKLNNRQLRSRIRQFAVNFTSQSDGAVFTVKAENNRFQAAVLVKERKIHVALRHHSSRVNLISVDDVIGVMQRIEVIGNGRKVDVYLNDRKGGLIKKDASEEILTTSQTNIGIHLGRVSSTRSVRGCIQGISLNDEIMPLNSMFDGENIIYGTCQQEDCFTFTNTSKPIQLPNITAINSLSFVFKYGSRGRILQYSKGKKFNLNIMIDKDGLDMTESVKDNSEAIDLPDSEFTQGDDVVVIVTDKDNEIKVGVGDESQTFSYGSNGGGGGFFSFFGIRNGNDDDNEDDNDADSSYNVTIGGGRDMSKEFIGSFATLLIENRPIDLSSYVTTNNLQRCSLPHTAKLTKTAEKKREPLAC